MQRRWFWSLLIGAPLLVCVLVVVLAPGADQRDAVNMSLAQAAILGVVEGLTEFLPISSTGHLLVVQRLLGIGTDGENSKQAADAFAICIQAGAILAILGLYFGRLQEMGRGLRGRDPAGRALLGNVVVAFLPAAVIGLTAGDWIRSQLFGPWPIVWAWAVGGVAILVVSVFRTHRQEVGTRGKALGELTLRAAFFIGLLQCVAMWPGVSRSLVTIVGGVLVGLSLRASVEFSFLLGLLTLGAATAYDVLQHGALLLKTYSPSAMALGFFAAFLSAVLAVRWMVRYLERHGLQLFGWYRIAIALVVAVLLLRGW
jgi:undecaprenyl-diphosphatase